MAFTIPRHRIDSPTEYVSTHDPAWDWDRITEENNAEEKLAREEKRKPIDHPVMVYFKGETRYSLNAPVDLPGGGTASAGDYFKENEKPTVWVLRRLGWKQKTAADAEIQRDANRGGDGTEVYVDLCRVGIVQVKNGPYLEGVETGRLTDEDMRILFEIGDRTSSVTSGIGQAIWIASSWLSDSEKKR